MTAEEYLRLFERESRELPRPGASRAELVAALPNVRSLILLAQKSGCGRYSSLEIEHLLCALAESLDTGRPEDAEVGHLLIVMSEAYDVGGHTRVVERWIEADSAHRYSVILTRQPSSYAVPPRLAAAVRQSGGEVVILDPKSDVLSRAAQLRARASRFEKVVLHIHTDDMIPVVAFGTERFPRPVGLYNHADHLFWIGASVADRVGEIRKTGIEFSRLRRGIPRTMLVGIPPETRTDGKSVPETGAARRPVIVSCGSAEKYRSVMGIDFIAPVERILLQVPEAEFVGIGMTFSDFPEWRAANRRAGGRIRLLGQIPYDKLLSHYDTAALYLDSRPMAGGTAIADALCRGCPVLSFPGPVGQMDWIFESPALCRSDAETVDRAVAILRKNVDVEDLLACERRTYEQHNRPELFRNRIGEFLAALQAPHRVHEISPQFSGFSELDEYHYSMNNGIDYVWRGWGRLFNVHYQLSPLERRKIVEILGVRFCIKRKRAVKRQKGAI